MLRESLYITFMNNGVEAALESGQIGSLRDIRTKILDRWIQGPVVQTFAGSTPVPRTADADR